MLENRWVLRSKLLVSVLVVLHVSAGIAAERDTMSDSLKLANESQAAQRGSVYVYGDQSLDLLIAVRVLGGVAKPGIHYVPPKTDLLTLISLAGGTTEHAVLDEVSIKRTSGGKVEVLSANLEKIVSRVDVSAPGLMTNDVVLVPVDRSWISDNTLRTVTLATGLSSIFLSIVVGIHNLK